MNIFSQFGGRVASAIKNLGLSEAELEAINFARIVVEPPRDASHGDLATNAAMVIAKPLKQKPRDLAEKIKGELVKDPDIEQVEVAGPGFINLRLSRAFWARHLLEIIEADTDYGSNFVAEPKKINVEYVSANPTGPMHVGHCRGAVVGDALASLASFAGHDVVREYYVNDAGAQIDVLARSVVLRYREALGEEIGAIPEGLYPGDYLVPLGQELAKEFGKSLLEMDEEPRLDLVRNRAIDAMMALIRDDLAALNVRHDVFFSERTLHKADGGESLIDATLATLGDRGLVYEGTLPPPKGQLPDDWEDRPQTLLKATDYGDDMDRPLKKSDGVYTYFAADVAYFRDKFERGFDKMVYVLGADHGGYVKRLKAVSGAIANDPERLSVVLCQLVKLLRAGEPVKMSKRSGNLITLRDVVEEVGADAVRFMMLYRKSDAPLDFDFEKVTEQSKDNPVFYVQYAHARTHSVLNLAKERANIDVSDVKAVTFDLLASLNDESEIALIQKMAAFPRIVETAYEAKEPHRIAFYLYELSNSFHAHWNLGKEKRHLRFINEEDRESTLGKLALVLGVNRVLRSGLTLLGVSAPMEMR